LSCTIFTQVRQIHTTLDAECTSGHREANHTECKRNDPDETGSGHKGSTKTGRYAAGGAVGAYKSNNSARRQSDTADEVPG